MFIIIPMNKTLPMLVIIIAISGCASMKVDIKNWSKSEKALAVGMVVGQAADYVSTIDGLEQGARELNPIAPSSKSGMVAFKAAGSYVILWCADRIEEYRKTILITGNIFGWGAATWNMGQID